MEWLRAVRWSPYAVGIGIGILSWLSFLLSDRTIGCSTPFACTSGMIERWFRGDKTLDKPYIKALVDGKSIPVISGGAGDSGEDARQGTRWE